MSRTNFAVRVIAKHRSSIHPVPWSLIRVNRANQLTWSVIKYRIAKDLGQFKNKSYTFDIDGQYFDNYANSTDKKFTLEDSILNNSCIVYSLVPIHYREHVHFIPHNAIEFTLDINEEKIQTQYY